MGLLTKWGFATVLLSSCRFPVSVTLVSIRLSCYWVDRWELGLFCASCFFHVYLDSKGLLLLGAQRWARISSLPG